MPGVGTCMLSTSSSDAALDWLSTALVADLPPGMSMLNTSPSVPPCCNAHATLTSAASFGAVCCDMILMLRDSSAIRFVGWGSMRPLRGEEGSIHIRKFESAWRGLHLQRAASDLGVYSLSGPPPALILRAGETQQEENEE